MLLNLSHLPAGYFSENTVMIAPKILKLNTTMSHLNLFLSLLKIDCAIKHH